MNKTGSILASVILMMASGVNAEENNLYVGASFGSSAYDVNKKDFIDDSSLNSLESKFDDTDSAFKIFGGYQINDYFAVEAAYTNLGGLSFSKGYYVGWRDPQQGSEGLLMDTLYATLEVTGFIVNGVAQYPISDDFSVFAKLGVFRWNVDASFKWISDYYLIIDNVLQSDIFYTEISPSSESDSGTDAFIGLGLSYQWSVFDIRAEYEIYESDGEKINIASLGVLYRF